MIDMVARTPHGAQTELVTLGPIFAVRPSHRLPSGGWSDPSIDRQPIGFGGHRDGRTVEVLPACRPAEAELGLLTSRWVLIRARKWGRAADGSLHRAEVDTVVGVGPI